MGVSGFQLISLTTMCGIAELLLLSLGTFWWEYWWIYDVAAMFAFLLGLSRHKMYSFFAVEPVPVKSSRWKSGNGFLLLANVIFLVILWPIDISLTHSMLSSFFMTPLFMIALLNFEELGWFMKSKYHQNVTSDSTI
jgi:hypothetical protein